MEKVIRIGKVSRLHGFKGELSLKVEPEFMDVLEEVELVFIEVDRKQVPFFIEHVRFTSTGFALVKFEEVSTEAEAQRLRNCEVFIREEDMDAEEMEAMEASKMHGYLVIDKHHGELGKVAELVIHPGNSFIVIEREDGEVMIPFHEDIVVEVDDANKKIHVITPEGLIGLNLEGNG